MHLRSRTMFLVGLFTLTGCVNIERPNGGDALYIGIVRISSADDTEADVSEQNEQILGVWSNLSGAGLGWRKGQLISVPDDCRLIFFISEQFDAEQAIAMLRAEFKEGEDICISERGGPY